MKENCSPEDDLLPTNEEEAQQRLIEFSHWRSIRPAWLREDRQEMRDILPSDQTAEYFGTMLCKKFEKALHQAYTLRADENDEDLIRRRAVLRDTLAQIPRPESWMDAWPDFWDFFTRQRPQGRTRLDSLFKAWPMMDEYAVDEILSAWVAGGRSDSLRFYAQITALGVNVPRTFRSMIAHLQLPFKELAREWCQRLGWKSQIDSGTELVSTEQKTSGDSESDGLSVGDKLADAQASDSATDVGLAELRQLLKLLPGAFFDDMTGKERAIVALRLFDVPLYKPPVSDCPDIPPPRGRDALYQQTFGGFVSRLQQKAKQIVANPVVKKQRQAASDATADQATVDLVAGILEEEIRRHIYAWLGHPAGAGVKLSENAPPWLLAILSATQPRWKTMNLNDLN
jgi:hypothetical protein